MRKKRHIDDERVPRSGTLNIIEKGWERFIVGRPLLHGAEAEIASPAFFEAL
jgi:hypothetical protein